MSEFLVIFSLVTLGSAVCLSAALWLRFMARKAAGGFVALSPGRSAAAASAPVVDPVLMFGFTVTCYGSIALALVCALPGRLALERTALAFGLLCVGGLIGEIAKSNAPAPSTDSEAEDAGPLSQDSQSDRASVSGGLSVALALTLNLAVAVLGSHQGLIEIVPPKEQSTAQSDQLAPILVVAQRSSDLLDRQTSAL